MSRPAGRPCDPSIYLVTDTTLCGEVGVAATARAAVAGGVSLVQVRDPEASDAELVALGREVVAALAGTGVPVIVTYHPAYLLRALPDKAKAWQDLCLALATIEGRDSAG